MKAFKHDARSSHHRPLQHFIRFLARFPKFCPPINCAAQQVMQADAWQADRVFQDVDAFFCLKRPHLIQGFQTRGYVEIVVVAQPVCESLHAFFFEDLLTFHEL